MPRSTDASSRGRDALSAGPGAPGSRGRPGGAAPSFAGALRGLSGCAHGLLSGAFDLLLEWQERSRQRQLLMGLDDRMLRDIGVTRYDANMEYRKPPWRR